MNRTHHGSGSGSELHGAPPNSNLHKPDPDSALPNGHDAKDEVIDAGLRSLDHCMSHSCLPVPPRALPRAPLQARSPD